MHGWAWLGCVGPGPKQASCQFKATTQVTQYRGGICLWCDKNEGRQKEKDAVPTIELCRYKAYGSRGSCKAPSTLLMLSRMRYNLTISQIGAHSL